uniref:Uncharacterized protein n=1 Tax=Candidozyma auris TaxID=498019 RepID=A0A0L0P1C8_CANAR
MGDFNPILFKLRILSKEEPKSASTFGSLPKWEFLVETPLKGVLGSVTLPLFGGSGARMVTPSPSAVRTECLGFGRILVFYSTV